MQFHRIADNDQDSRMKGIIEFNSNNTLFATYLCPIWAIANNACEKYVHLTNRPLSVSVGGACLLNKHWLQQLPLHCES